MNRRALWYGLAYTALFIAFKLFIVLGGYSLSRFGYFYSNITAVLLIIPFYVACVKTARDRDYGGIISGREAVRLCLTIFAVSAILTSVYHYFEYVMSGQQLAIEYYHSEQFLDFLRAQPKIKEGDYDRIITEQVKGAEGAAFRATTGKLFSMVLIGLSGSFIVSSLMKRSR
jgi:hypothetical protein